MFPSFQTAEYILGVFQPTHLHQEMFQLIPPLLQVWYVAQHLYVPFVPSHYTLSCAELHQESLIVVLQPLVVIVDLSQQIDHRSFIS